MKTLLIGATFCATSTFLSASLFAHDDEQPSRDIVTTALEAGQFKTLATALEAAELVETLQGPGPFTVFAPTDEAFAKLPAETLAQLLQPAGKAQLTAILTYHVVAGQVEATAALTAGAAPTVQGEEVAFRLQDGGLRVNEARVVANDIRCTNGIIHVIDTVLLPPQKPVKKVIGIYSKSPGRTTRDLLNLDRGQGYLVTDLMSGRGAQAAGLQGHDVIVAVNGQPATQDLFDLAKDKAGVGGYVDITYARTVRVQVSAQEE